jgi:hypothetical protein
MLSTKRFDGNLTITTVGNTSTITLHSPTVIIEGDLTVKGTNTSGSVVTVETTNTVIQDNIITLNGGATGVPASTLTSGFEVNRGSRPTVGIRWNESLARWELTADNVNWEVIISGAALKHVVEDPAPQLGGSLDTNGFAVQFSKLTGSAIPADNSTLNIIYGAAVGSGGTGIKFVSYDTRSSRYVRDELVSRKKGIVQALIF